MPKIIHVLLPVLIFAVVLGAPLPVADAASTQYLITGELPDSNPTLPDRNPRNPRGFGDLASVPDGTFAFRLNFDEPAEPDFDLLGFSSETQPFAADSWSLDLFGATGLTERYNQDTNPDFLGFASFAGELTGFDSGETYLTLGVDTNPAPGRVALDDTLINVDFFADELVAVFFTDDLKDVPQGIAFDGGSILDLGSGLRVPVASARLVAAQLDDPVLVEEGNTDGQAPITGGNNGQTPGGGPAAVPTPGAAVGGLLLLLMLVVRQLNRTQQRVESA